MFALRVAIVWGYLVAAILLAAFLVVVFLVVLAKAFWGLILVGLLIWAAAKITTSYRRKRADTYGVPPQF